MSQEDGYLYVLLSSSTVKQIKVRVDMVRHRIKEHMLKKYTQTEEKFTGAFNMMGDVCRMT